MVSVYSRVFVPSLWVPRLMSSTTETILMTAKRKVRQENVSYVVGALVALVTVVGK